ncbi:MAG TPA: matrixin [Halococcus sp.]|nr:matrixin [Halococcus sp.]
MAGTARALVVVFFVVSAGCIGLSGHSLPDELAGLTGDSDNPYPDDELVVAVDSNHSDRAFDPLVREALAYWEHHDKRYLNYSVNFTLAQNTTNPDLRVAFVPEIERCGSVSEAAGCAPRVTAPVSDTIVIQSLDDLSAESTVRVLEHEFGHALGLSHDGAPHDLMRAHAILTTLPRPNATERALAWDDHTLSVFIGSDASSADREQIRHALAYYDRGAAGTVPKNVSFRLTDDSEHADIVVRFPANSPCGFGPGSCGSISGTDPDGDGALERYTRLKITLTGLDSDVVGWHVARWLALGFGIENESDYPPVLRKTSDENRRNEWWR